MGSCVLDTRKGRCIKSTLEKVSRITRKVVCGNMLLLYLRSVAIGPMKLAVYRLVADRVLVLNVVENHYEDLLVPIIRESSEFQNSKLA